MLGGQFMTWGIVYDLAIVQHSTSRRARQAPSMELQFVLFLLLLGETLFIQAPLQFPLLFKLLPLPLPLLQLHLPLLLGMAAPCTRPLVSPLAQGSGTRMPA